MSTFINTAPYHTQNQINYGLTRKAKKIKKQVAKQKLKKTALEILCKYKNIVEDMNEKSLTIVVESLSDSIHHYGLKIQMTGGLFNVIESALNTKKVSSMRYRELEGIQRIFAYNFILVNMYLSYQDYYSFDSVVRELIPMYALTEYIFEMFQKKIDVLNKTKSTTKFENKIFKMLAYLHKVGAIEISANESVDGAELLAEKLRSGISGYTTKKSAKNKTQNHTVENDKEINIFDNLINNAYKVHYKSGKNGKHSSHKSPVIHKRKDFWRTTKNGLRVHVRETMVGLKQKKAA
ncbi:hypothetical protein [Sulfurimonas xiamenensis]|uniref:Uncharacterized protein n=1 Tax=Sulfurimonas xiamenensis TaxID=2590021 RepID=A0AAJ4DMC4_9BACT|nr:hypothetical protein [Sulfurimonas xiamenensis]QFR42880.1 hypothetical protein FJR47_02725 [Sulfurimonas xiamenensis]